MRHAPAPWLAGDGAGPGFTPGGLGFLARQALEQVLKASIMLGDPLLTHDLSLQATLAGITLTPPLLGLHPPAVKACSSAEATPLPADRTLLLKDIEALVNALEARLGDEVTGLPAPVRSTGRAHLRR